MSSGGGFRYLHQGNAVVAQEGCDFGAMPDDEGIELIAQGVITLAHAHRNGELELLGRKPVPVLDRGDGQRNRRQLRKVAGEGPQAAATSISRFSTASSKRAGGSAWR